jgi:O-antigen/teichoic acid export membrane protein
MTTLRIASASSIVAISIFFLSSSLVPVEWILLAYLGIPAFFNWVFYFEAAKKFPGRIVGSSFDLKYALLCTVQKFTNTTINENVLILIVGLLFGVSELAFFQVAFFCFASLVGFFSALSSVYVPLLFKYKDIALWRHIFQNFCLGLIIVIPYVVLVWFLFVPVFGLEYSEGRSIALGFSLIVPFIPIKIFLLNYLISRNRNGFVSMTNIVSGFFAALSLWIFQGDGILFSVVVSYGLLNSIQIFLPSLAVIYFSPKDSRNTDSI